MTELPGDYFDHDSAVDRMVNVISELIDGQLPAFIIRQACDEIDLVTNEAFKTCDWKLVENKPSFDITVTAWKSVHSFGLRSRHIEHGGFMRYPEYDIGGIHFRGHDAVEGAANVWMRSSCYKEVGSPSHRFKTFEPDREKPIHTTTQQPGDRVMFILIGGVANGNVIHPAQHDFKREKFVEKARHVRVTDFVALPA